MDAPATLNPPWESLDRAATVEHAVRGDTDGVRDVLQRLQPGAAFHVVPDAGHWVAYEAPAAFASALCQALQTERSPA